MSELTERRWAVISERGCEASSMSYEEATRLRHRLVQEKVPGLCIVPDETAYRLINEESVEVASTPSNKVSS